ncbi:helix-turn-helix transcriptional regulator [Geodermatophilus sp. CPCC 205761]|uniref:helix-turn-helix transcriptional regulator n=1 Tax=Geodermatophilus sp. CPCC 205761 TaxID=2936597 RepID=UPI003EED5D8E
MAVSPHLAPWRGDVLPVVATPLVGRDAELPDLVRLLTEPGVRFTTLTGPPGVGKTRLAVAAAATARGRFCDGVVFLDLTAVRDPAAVPAEVAAAADLRHGDRSPADRDLLVVLDNVEHVLAAGPALAELVADSPGLHLLATSRERLHLRVEREVPVAPLALPGCADGTDPERLAAVAAVAMLVEQVRTSQPDFAVTVDNAAELAGICTRLDGLPLALELAAPRLRLFTPGELLFRLRHRLGVLTSDARDVPARHRTLRAALTWSHDLLGPEERTLFRRLSVFTGTWTLDAAARVCGIADPVPATASLVDKNLVRRQDCAGDVARFGMLESLREFAAEQLDRAGEAAATRARYARHVTVGPAGTRITRREREVAGLVRRGRTNRQIGRALGISEKTAEVHVHNIIRKLRASSRAEIAAWAAVHDRAADR